MHALIKNITYKIWKNDNTKIHISSSFILSVGLLIMLDTLLLRLSLHCNTSLHFTTLHPATLHYTSPNYTSLPLSTLHFLSFTLHPATLHYTNRHFTSSRSHFTTLHHTSPNYTSLPLSTLHFLSFTLHTSPSYTSLHLPTLQFLSFILHCPLIWLNPFTFAYEAKFMSGMGSSKTLKQLVGVLTLQSLLVT